MVGVFPEEPVMETSTEMDRMAANRVPPNKVPTDDRAKVKANNAAVDAGNRVSLDPMRTTDRYRLVMPYADRLRTGAD